MNGPVSDSSEFGGAPSGAPLDPIAYDEIARHFFAEFMELRDVIRSGANPTELMKEAQQERAKYVEANRQRANLASANEALEIIIDGMERQATDLRRQLNEALMEVARLKELQGGRTHIGTGTPLADRLSAESKKELEEYKRLMTQRPATNPSRREERE